MIYSQEHVSMNSTLYMVVFHRIYTNNSISPIHHKKEQIKDVKYFPDTTKIGFIWYYYELKHLISFFLSTTN